MQPIPIFLPAPKEQTCPSCGKPEKKKEVCANCGHEYDEEQLTISDWAMLVFGVFAAAWSFLTLLVWIIGSFVKGEDAPSLLEILRYQFDCIKNLRLF